MRHETFRNSSQTAKEFQLTIRLQRAKHGLMAGLHAACSWSRLSSLSTVLSLQSSLKERCYWKLVSVFYHLACTSWLLAIHQSVATRKHISSVKRRRDARSHCPGIVVSQEGERNTGNTVKFILRHPLLNTRRKTSHANSDKPTCMSDLPVSISNSVQPQDGALQSDWSITRQCLSWLEFQNSRRQSHGA